MGWSAWHELGRGYFYPDRYDDMSAGPLKEYRDALFSIDFPYKNPSQYGRVIRNDAPEALWDEVYQQLNGTLLDGTPGPATEPMPRVPSTDFYETYRAETGFAIGYTAEVNGASAFYPSGGGGRVYQQFSPVAFAPPPLPNPTSTADIDQLPAMAGLVQGAGYDRIPGTDTYFEYDGPTTFLNWFYRASLSFYVESLDQYPLASALTADLQADLVVISLEDYAAYVKSHLSLPRTSGHVLDSVVRRTIPDGSGNASFAYDIDHTWDPLPVDAERFGYSWRMPGVPSEILARRDRGYGSIKMTVAGGEGYKQYPGQNAGAGIYPGPVTVYPEKPTRGLWAHAQMPRYRWWIPETGPAGTSTQRPPLRQVQRGDGLGLGGVPRAVQRKSQQASLRRGPSTLS